MKEEGRKGRRKKEAHMYLNTRQRAERGKERGRTKTEGGREKEKEEGRKGKEERKQHIFEYQTKSGERERERKDKDGGREGEKIE